mgnify:CR=1 FL=1
MLLGLDPLVTEETISKIPVKDDTEDFEIQHKSKSGDIVSRVHTRVSVAKDGKVKVNITAPIENLYTEYYSKCIKPPIKVRVCAFQKVGFTDDQLLDMIKKDEVREKNKENLDVFIQAIFGNVSSKSAPPKKKTLQQLIKFKPIKPVTCDDPTIDEEEES